MGSIDTLSAGFSLVNKRLWLIIIPISLDLLLWMGPQVSIAPFITRALNGYQGLLAQTTADAALPYQPAPQETAGVLEQIRQAAQPIEQSNLLGILAWQMPSIIRGGPSGLGLKNIFYVEDGATLLLVVSGLLLSSLFIASTFMSMVAQLVRGESIPSNRFVSIIFTNGAKLTAYFLLLAASAAILVPLALVLTSAIGMASPAGASLLGAMLAGAALWLALYLFFALDAIFVTRSGPWGAIQNSFRTVRHHFWPALSIFAIINVILWGTPIAWRLVMAHPLGIAVSIVGNAYVATGLTAASMIFYRQRYSLGRRN